MDLAKEIFEAGCAMNDALATKCPKTCCYGSSRENCALGTETASTCTSPIEHKAPKEVRSSACGCRNCLWASCECSFGSKYKEAEPVKLGKKTVATCAAYSYYN